MKTLIAVFLFSNVLYAANSDCGKLEKIKLSLSVHASNILNVKTTRTPEGGAYHRQAVADCDSSCKVIKKKEVLLKYEPNHPDANENGYVEYPSFNEAHEIHSFVSNMHKLEILSKEKKCGLKYKKVSKGFLINYPKGQVSVDEFILPQHELISGWRREFKTGKDTLVSFNDSYTPKSLPGDFPNK